MGSQQELNDHSSEDELNPHLITGNALPWFGNPVIYEDKIRWPADPRESDELQEIDHRTQQYNVNTVPRFEKVRFSFVQNRLAYIEEIKPMNIAG